MNAVLAIFNAIPALKELLVKFIDLYLQWEKEQQEENFKNALKTAIEKHDQRPLDGGDPSLREGVRIREPKP